MSDKKESENSVNRQRFQDGSKVLKFEELLQAPAELMGREGGLVQGGDRRQNRTSGKRGSKDWTVSGEVQEEDHEDGSGKGILTFFLLLLFYCSKQEKLVV
ncbi:hypothetical protein HPP92_010862 [Vanilla planifolia]|uniref:Uncharacterized protein n=1 Tax=Vanilla planifolia TaxID=51239 RepID=A0A835QWH5_VANPL|nr:hypothetical protein HPP92_010862 [Vanilla planifolia]